MSGGVLQMDHFAHTNGDFQQGTLNSRLENRSTMNTGTGGIN